MVDSPKSGPKRSLLPVSTPILKVDPDEPEEERLQEAADLLRSGGVVALPTETFYGLAADPFDPSAVKNLNALKGKSPDSPSLLLLAGPEQVEQVAGPIPESFRLLAGRFWPGPLTLVVRASCDLPGEVTGGGPTVGIRVPGLALPRRLAALLGRPVTGVSANLHGRPPCRTAQEVVEALREGVSLVLDGGRTAGAAPSTVLDLSGDRPRVIREGAVALSSLRALLPEIRG